MDQDVLRMAKPNSVSEASNQCTQDMAPCARVNHWLSVPEPTIRHSSPLDVHGTPCTHQNILSPSSHCEESMLLSLDHGLGLCCSMMFTGNAGKWVGRTVPLPTIFMGS